MRDTTIGWTQFAIDQHSKESGNSYTELSHATVCNLVSNNWNKRKPGKGEDCLTRKIVVPLSNPKGFFCPPRARIVEGLPVYAELYKRQSHEEPYIRTFAKYNEAAELNALHLPVPKSVEIVCYHKDVLLENDGERSTDCDWEIVCLLCSETDGDEPMQPLTMARNYLEKAGGTKTEYTAQEFAEAIYYHSTGGTVRVKMESV